MVKEWKVYMIPCWSLQVGYSKSGDEMEISKWFPPDSTKRSTLDVLIKMERLSSIHHLTYLGVNQSNVESRMCKNGAAQSWRVSTEQQPVIPSRTDWLSSEVTEPFVAKTMQIGKQGKLLRLTARNAHPWRKVKSTSTRALLFHILMPRSHLK